MNGALRHLDAAVTVTTSGWLDVELFEDGALARRQHVAHPAAAQQLVRAWLDDHRCLHPIGEDFYGPRCSRPHGHTGACLP
jgi:hypothetical protein